MAAHEKLTDPKWLPVLRAADRAALKSLGRGDYRIFDKKALDQSLGTASRGWIRRLIQLQLVSPVWTFATTGRAEYMVTKFGLEVLQVANG